MKYQKAEITHCEWRKCVRYRFKWDKRKDEIYKFSRKKICPIKTKISLQSKSSLFSSNFETDFCAHTHTYCTKNCVFSDLNMNGSGTKIR